MDKATDSAAETVEVDGAAAQLFGNDELGRLQNILLGDHARKTGDRIDMLETALLGVIEDLRGEMRDNVAALEKRIDAEASTRTKAVTNVTERLTTEVADRKSDVKTLSKDVSKDLRATENDFNNALDAATSTLTSHVDDLRATTAELADANSSVAAAKVDRLALAALLTKTAEALEDSPE